MQTGEIYFIKNSLFQDFPDTYAMPNKYRGGDTSSHDRPYCIGYTDPNTGILWAVPLSSQISKYEKICMVNKRAKIRFYRLLGQMSVFLVQNMIPVTPGYINNQYIIRFSPVRISHKDSKDLEKFVRTTINMVRHNKTNIFTDIIRLERLLLEAMATAK